MIIQDGVRLLKDILDSLQVLILDVNNTISMVLILILNLIINLEDFNNGLMDDLLTIVEMVYK